MRRHVLVLVGAGLVLAGCTTGGRTDADRPTSANDSAVIATNAAVVRTAVEKQRHAAAEINTAYHVGGFDTGSATISLTGTYDFRSSSGQFEVGLSQSGKSRTFTERIFTDRIYLEGLVTARPGARWTVFPRPKSISRGPLRTPGNSPEGLLAWAESATGMQKLETAVSVNGVLVDHYQGVISPAELMRTSTGTARKQYTQLIAELGDDAHRIDVYIDRQGYIRRLYWGISDGGASIKTQTEFVPKSTRVTVPKPTKGVIDGAGARVDPTLIS